MTINLTAHLLTPAHSRAPPPARVGGVRQSVIFEPGQKNLTVTIIFSGNHPGVELQRAQARAHSPEHSSDGTTVKGPDVPARARDERAFQRIDERKIGRSLSPPSVTAERGPILRHEAIRAR